MSVNKKSMVIGFIGLGTMGEGMAMNLLKDGYKMNVYDIVVEKLKSFTQMGATAYTTIEDLVKKSDVVMTSLPSSKIMVDVACNRLIPASKEGQIFIDLGTVTAPEARHLSSRFNTKGAIFLDAPVSGGARGAQNGNLYIFIGGDKKTSEECMPVFHSIGDPDHVVYCGESGCGQIIKGVNQMAMGLGAAAYLESIAFGVRAGVDAKTILKAVGGETGWRSCFTAVAKQVAEDNGHTVGVKHGQMEYFMEEAREKGFGLPLAKALFKFCEHAEKTIVEANRLSPSFWNELLNYTEEDEEMEK